MTGQRVVCTECPYRKVIDAESDTPAAEYVIEHGTETGHTLSVELVAEEDVNTND